jgi:hypothetical protein
MNNILSNLQIKTILDYGAGLGRNLPLLLKFTEDVYYLDLLTYKNIYNDEIKI